MRSVSTFALGILIALCTSANAAKVHHANPHYAGPRHAVVHPGQDEVIPPGWVKYPGYPPIPPELNRNLDPSTRGSG